jgi:hypothetical protein
MLEQGPKNREILRVCFAKRSFFDTIRYFGYYLGLKLTVVFNLEDMLPR